MKSAAPEPLRNTLDLLTGKRAVAVVAPEAEVIKRHIERNCRWLIDPGFIGVGLGRRTAAGQTTDEWAIKVYVAQKLPIKRLETLIPQSIRLPTAETAVPLDVEEVGSFTLTASADPVEGQIHHEDHPDSAGTPTCLLQSTGTAAKRQFYLLSCAHVMAPNNSSADVNTKKILYRAADGKSLSVGTLVGWSTIGRSGRAVVPTDAAIARLDDDSPFMQSYLASVNLPSDTSGDIDVGDLIQIRGARSKQVIDFRVEDTDVRLPEDYPNDSIFTPFGMSFRNVVSATPVAQDLIPGDSGAPVFNEHNHLLGIFFASGPQRAFFTRIKPTLEFFAVPPFHFDLEVVTRGDIQNGELLGSGQVVSQPNGDNKAILPPVTDKTVVPQVKNDGRTAGRVVATPLAVGEPDSAVTIMAKTIWGEARGEPHLGREAVAAVIANRVRSGKSHYGNTVETVCLKKSQFSCWNPDDPNRTLLDRIPATDGVYRQCREISARALNGSLADPTNGATHYYATSIPAPSWAIDKTPCAEIGSHRFFNNID